MFWGQGKPFKSPNFQFTYRLLLQGTLLFLTGTLAAPQGQYSAPQCTTQRFEEAINYNCKADQECQTSYEQKCDTTYENVCETKYEQQCQTEYENKCETRYENQCQTSYEDECQTKVCLLYCKIIASAFVDHTKEKLF